MLQTGYLVSDATSDENPTPIKVLLPRDYDKWVRDADLREKEIINEDQ